MTRLKPRKTMLFRFLFFSPIWDGGEWGPWLSLISLAFTSEKNHILARVGLVFRLGSMWNGGRRREDRETRVLTWLFLLHDCFARKWGESKVWVCLSLMPAKIQLFPPRHTSSTSRGVLRDLAISRVGGLYSPLKINPPGQPMPGLTPCYARVRLSGGMCRAVTHYIPPLQHHTSRPAGGIPQIREIIEEDNGEMSSFLRSPTSLCLF